MQLPCGFAILPEKIYLPYYYEYIIFPLIAIYKDDCLKCRIFDTERPWRGRIRQYIYIALGQYRIIEQERFASKFCVLTRRGFAVILDVLPWNLGSADGTRARNRSQSQGTKFPQSAAAARTELAQGAAASIVRCCRKSVVRKGQKKCGRKLQKVTEL